MAGVWKGFTDEDIGLYRKNENVQNDRSKAEKKPANLQGSGERKTSGGNILAKYKAGAGGKAHAQSEIPETPKLFKSSTECSDETSVSSTLKSSKEPDDEKVEDEKEGKEKESESPVMGSNSVCLKVIEGKAYELVDVNSGNVSKATLEIFEARQKKLEEENKKKKEMLSKIILARKKQTSEEAKRLQHIQEELQKLDVRLSNDVGILRDKIEAATLDFAEAQKRYNKAEKEFLDAKQNLFGKLEKKELLTKYLCTIIEQNEVRKAQKLSELMEKLEVT